MSAALSLSKEVSSAIRDLSGPKQEAVVGTLAKYQRSNATLREKLAEDQSMVGQAVEDVQYLAGAALRGATERLLENWGLLDSVGPALKFGAPAAWGASAASGIRPLARMAVGFTASDVRDAFAGDKAIARSYGDVFARAAAGEKKEGEQNATT